MINCGKNETQIARERQRDHGMQTHDGQDYAYYEVPSRFQVMLSTAQKYSLIVVRPLVRPRKPATDKHFGPPLAGLPGGQYSSPPTPCRSFNSSRHSFSCYGLRMGRRLSGLQQCLSLSEHPISTLGKTRQLQTRPRTTGRSFGMWESAAPGFVVLPASGSLRSLSHDAIAGSRVAMLHSGRRDDLHTLGPGQPP